MIINLFKNNIKFWNVHKLASLFAICFSFCRIYLILFSSLQLLIKLYVFMCYVLIQDGQQWHYIMYVL